MNIYGYFTSFRINGYQIFADKNSYSHEIMSLFNENMKVVKKEEIDGEVYLSTYYSVSVSDFISRLEIMGYTYERAMTDFNNSFN
ncbi:hypothetical protein KPL47_02250 [Clostridium estertheticum]|uniref:HEPN/Toprim-associated domain-containing protein n=1 Tax=Clostridium estertheticum TaxID=238834 RepID=UPI001C0C379B|nr:HEPN/Toprim-associated domain-containing protein [Clostridium estertheticum]MBU3175185.1 hypothetical protein [Clostridium estertheticum]